MQSNENDFERLSALLDGELADDEFHAALDLAADCAEGREAWHVYHLVGDVLRSPELASASSAVAFAERFSERLRAEGAPAPGVADLPFNMDSIAQDGHLTMGYGQNDSKKPVAANEGRFAWQLVAGFASLVVVATLGWNLLAAEGGDAQPLLAQQPPAAAPAAGAGGHMIRDPRLDELMAAHRQSGNVSALHNPSGFLRNATFGGSER